MCLSLTSLIWCAGLSQYGDKKRCKHLPCDSHTVLCHNDPQPLNIILSPDGKGKGEGEGERERGREGEKGREGGREGQGGKDKHTHAHTNINNPLVHVRDNGGYFTDYMYMCVFLQCSNTICVYGRVYVYMFIPLCRNCDTDRL